MAELSGRRKDMMNSHFTNKTKFPFKENTKLTFLAINLHLQFINIKTEREILKLKVNIIHSQLINLHETGTHQKSKF